MVKHMVYFLSLFSLNLVLWCQIMNKIWHVAQIYSNYISKWRMCKIEGQRNYSMLRIHLFHHYAAEEKHIWNYPQVRLPLEFNFALAKSLDQKLHFRQPKQSWNYITCLDTFYISITILTSNFLQFAQLW